MVQLWLGQDLTRLRPWKALQPCGLCSAPAKGPVHAAQRATGRAHLHAFPHALQVGPAPPLFERRNASAALPRALPRLLALLGGHAWRPLHRREGP